jgi:pyruvate/2-oxoglutarate dehydrogenase complex dihydrolipoamide dehydrogenase (E3) component
MGSGRFLSPKTIEVQLNDGGTRLLSGDQIVLNIGTHAAIPDISGLAAAQPLTHVEALELDYAPAHLVVLGGGYVGLEMAQAYRRFGSRVTVVEPGSQILSREDPDVASAVQNVLGDEGVVFLTSTQMLAVEGRSGQKVTVTLRSGNSERVIEASDILVAAGRIANTAEIGLEKAGIEVDTRGFIRVNDRLETTAADVWAIGECAGSPQFTHVSNDDFRIVKDNMAGGKRSTRDRLIPHCLFIEPPLAHVGLTEREAERQSVKLRAARLPMKSVLRTEATGETQGFMKVLVSADDDRILGFTMLGAEAGEVMTAVQMAMLARTPYSIVRDAVITHLTYAEGLGPLLSNIEETSAA